LVQEGHELNRLRFGGIRLAVILVLALGAGAAWSQVVGGVTSVRNASVAPGGPAQRFVPLRPGAKVQNGDGVRTGRRGYAEITFLDGSIVRVNERTELVIRDTATMRRLVLQQGALWVRVADGAATQVQTPVATATARGTIFEVTADGQLRVLEGAVDLEGLGGEMQTVEVGEIARVGADGVPVKVLSLDTRRLTSEELTRLAETPGWWTSGRPPVMVSPGGFAGRVGETLAALGLGLPLITSFGGQGVSPARPDNGAVAVVPEPAALLALAGGVALLALRRRRK
jgi:hypothetical protein